MTYDKRHIIVAEIYKHVNTINANKDTIVLLLATMADKELLKFHKKFLEKTEVYTGE